MFFGFNFSQVTRNQLVNIRNEPPFVKKSPAAAAAGLFLLMPNGFGLKTGIHKVTNLYGQCQYLNQYTCFTIYGYNGNRTGVDYWKFTESIKFTRKY